MKLKYKLLSLLLMQILALGGTTPVGQTKPTASYSIPEMTLRVKSVGLDTSTDRISRIAIGPNSNFYVLDAGNNRVLIFSSAWKLVRQISEIGQGPGGLFDPYDMAVDRGGNVYVIDSKQRVQGFSAEGKFYGSFKYKGECLAIAVNGRGEYLLSQPESGSLISVYGPNGDYRRSFGSLKTGAARNARAVANRVHMFVTSKDDVYVSFDHLGILQKYDASGRLQWEEAIPGEQAEKLRNIFWSNATDKSKYGIVLTTSYSGVPAFFVSFSILLDESRDRLYVPLNDGSIYVADARGKPLQFLKQRGSTDFYNSIAVDRLGRLIVSSVWKGVFLIMPAPRPV
jgi:hypothetical protein